MFRRFERAHALSDLREPSFIRFPSHVRDLGSGAEVWPRIAVAVETPAHAERLLDAHDLHLVDAAVTAHAADARREVDAVIEEGVVGHLVHANPLDGLPRLPAVTDRLEHRRV